MAVDVNSNKYTFIFATVMVIVVATLLALASESLKPMQKKNVANEKRQNILSSVGIDVSAAEAETAYNENLVEALVLDANGNVVESPAVEAFDIDVLKDYKAGLSNIYKANADDMDAMKSALLSWGDGGVNYPLFVLQKDGENVYVVPVVGTGLWGPIWGYITIASDGKTVVGAVFDHKSETPGLGAEINQASFQKPFEGKTIFDENGDYVGIKVMKGGAQGSPNGVDAISGGTITSNGVTEMIVRTLKIYEPYLSSLGAGTVEAEVELPVDSLAVATDSLNVEEVKDSLELSAK
ncbi:MAG: NADH:ubiquinone reductase (Na(+)-transporting) subunit C [Flavobacteriales bacterium]|nr:NADH:ubiquinone reductase (Na(+)-transporting) subunit C [Flavobacteriales bacterium]MCB9192058.1 NADH:ubiquinone reductase (Na(+)-transporting) subunit C [Flavobacteriales bacterium]